MHHFRLLHYLLLFFLPPVLLLLLSASCTGTSAYDGEFTFDGFSSNDLTMDGEASVTNSLLRLTSGRAQLKGHAFYTSPLNFTSATTVIPSFSTTFVFAIIGQYEDLSSHGLAFVLSSTREVFNSAFPAQYMGLLNAHNNGNSSNHLLAVELDTILNSDLQDINGNHIGIDINSLVSVASAPAGYYGDDGKFHGLRLCSREPMQVWVDYDSNHAILNVTIAPYFLSSTKPSRPLLSVTYNISSVLPATSVYAGFSSATGILNCKHYVLGWSFKLDGEAAALDSSSLSVKTIQELAQEVPVLTHNYKTMLCKVLLPVVVVSILASALLVKALHMKRQLQARKNELDWQKEHGGPSFTYKDLLAATNGFKDNMLLGRGGFGSVYKGVLPISKRMVAIKQVSPESKQGMKEFMAEILILGHLSHRNLVQLIGYCRHKRQLLLVYDYMPNGSLDSYLHAKHHNTTNLCWPQRFHIIKGVASALFYLHENWDQVVIHRDIKTSNVLLDCEMNARLGDFGLARSYDHGADAHTTCVAGTRGYIAPEMAQLHKATKATDIFAFGVLMMEVACARRPIWVNAANGEPLYLAGWVLDARQGGSIIDAVDPRLDDYVEDEIELVLKLGLLCSHPSPNVRPCLRLVMQYLQRDAPLPSDFQWNSWLSIDVCQDEMHDQHAMSCPTTSITDLSKGSVGIAHVTCYSLAKFQLGRMISLLPGAAVVVNSQEYTPYWPYCSTTDNYTNGSPYQANLFELMTVLKAGAIANGGFNVSTAGNASAGTGDAVFGLAMCFADRDWQQCKDCIMSATAQQTCPFSREMKACYGYACVLRYSNQSFFSVADLSVAFYARIDTFVADMAGMNATRWALMSRLSVEASASPLRLANGSEVFRDADGSSQPMYGLAQCTRDLNASECTRCLTYMVAQLSTSRPNNTYGSVKGYSCYVVYQIGTDLGVVLPPSPAPPAPEPPLSPSSSPPPRGRNKAGLVAAGASVGSVLLAAALGVLAWRLRPRSWRKGMAEPEQELVVGDDAFDGEPQEEEFERGAGPRRFRHRDLAVATGHFSDAAKLGEGGFGSVYHGHLKDTDLDVAIKRVSKNSNQGRKEYESEVKIISRLRHRNLVELIGWCHAGDELLLVYELMPKGSLDAHIHDAQNVLPWPIRHKIVLGIGSALLYLHHDCQKCVLHRDIKPSNIMLDASFNAKLGDFGLARLVDHGRRSHTTVLAGTMGYMDPNCMATGSASVESDVYSFGVVLLEIACGRPPRILIQEDEDEDDGAAKGTRTTTLHLVQWVWDKFYAHGRLLDAADARLDGELDAGEVERVMVTALWCTHPDRTRRPSIREAVNVLRMEAQLPSLPAKMPVATFVAPPLDHRFFQYDTAAAGTGSSSTGTTTGTSSSSTGTIGATATTETSSLLR
ncbi:hypothetical protein U9M48_036971 [Paspalum notatum var. saurae]|uniref:non-specific serine/threonine protein kinase n=1 Tax=Paspalum notatum var. saurae TaxID=547442 RepID=A0AAQ3UEQ0_PASNO